MNELIIKGAGAEGSFDYASIPASKRQQTQDAAESIRGLLTRTAANVVQIGLRLRLVHTCLGREHFQSWLRAEFCWSQSVASNYMRAAAFFGSIECIAQFQPGALYVLARKKVPESARQDAVHRALGGELISKARADEIVSKHGAAGSRDRHVRAPHLRGLIRRLAKEMQHLSGRELHQLERDVDRLLSQLRTALSGNEAR